MNALPSKPIAMMMIETVTYYTEKARKTNGAHPCYQVYRAMTIQMQLTNDCQLHPN
jgi:hypothetical protein